MATREAGGSWPRRFRRYVEKGQQCSLQPHALHANRFIAQKRSRCSSWWWYIQPQRACRHLGKSRISSVSSNQVQWEVFTRICEWYMWHVTLSCRVGLEAEQVSINPSWLPETLILVQRQNRHSRQNYRIYCIRKLLAFILIWELSS